MRESERWIALPTRAGQADDSSVFVLSKGSNTMGLMPQDAYRLLRTWDRFRSSEEQAAWLISQGLRKRSQRSLNAQIHALTESGRLLSLSALTEQLTILQEPRRPIEYVAWPTRDRHRDLLRSVNSWISILREYDRRPSFLVVDDSEHDARDNRLALSALAESDGISVDYLGSEAKEAAFRRLEASGLQPHLLRFAFLGEGGDGKPYGINRNWLSLSSIGFRAVSVDDNPLGEYAVGDRKGDAVRVFPGENPILVRPFEGPHELANLGQFDEDPLLNHELVLGRTVGSVLAERGLSGPRRSRVDLSHVTPELARRLAYDNGRVLASTTGVWGDSVLAHRDLILRLDGYLRDQMGTFDDYESARQATQVLYASKGSSLVPNTNIFAASFAADYATALPPFFPFGRGEDTIWSATIDACFPEGWAAHLPQAVAHRPSKRPETRQEGPFGLSFARVVKILIRGYPHTNVTRDGWSRMRDIGDYLVRLSSADWPEFQHFTLLQWLPNMSRSISQLEALLLIHNRQPANWAADVDAHIGSLHQYAVSEDFAIPTELRTYPDGRPRPREEARRMLQEYVRKYGELLIAWPDIVSVAKELKAAERFPIKRLG